MQIPEIFNFLDIIMNHVANFFISFPFERQREKGNEEKEKLRNGDNIINI